MKLLFLILLVFFLSCNSKSKNVESEIRDNSMNIDEFTMTDHAIEDSIIFKDCSIIFLETADDSFMREINRIYKTKDYIFIFDKSLEQVLIFNDQGKYQNKIQNIGQGAHEYQSLMDFCLDTEKEQIVLLCDNPYKIMRFNYQGQFISEIKHSDFFKNIVMDSHYVYCNRSELNRTELDKYEICCMERNGKQIDNLLEIRKNITNSIFDTGNFLNRTMNVYYSRRFDNAVYQVDKDKLTRKYTFDFGKFNLPDYLINERDMKKFSDECKEKKYIYSITEFVENEKYILFNTNQSICVYNKSQRTFTGYPRIKNTEFGIESNSFYSNGNDEKSIVVKIEPGILHMLKGYMEDNENITTLLEKVKEDDNPILFFYQFKN
jgi:hypothetical protein